MKFLVTGGAGLIGHNVVALLEKQGHQVLVLDTLTNYGFIPEKEVQYLHGERRKKYNAQVHNIDICDPTCDMHFKRFRPDVVIHLASFPRQKAVESIPTVAAKVMCEGLTNLLELSKAYFVSRFVYISSSMVYGDFDMDVTETANCAPRGQYGIFKLMGERLVEDYARRTEMSYTILRPSAVYGELDVEDRVVSKFILNAIRGRILKVNGPDEVLDFTYVEDAAMGIVQAALSDRAKNNTYNITRSAERPYTLLDAACLAVDMAGRGTVRLGDRDLSFPKRGRLDISKAIRDFDYAPTVNVEEGFLRYYKWLSTSPYFQ